MEVTPLQNVLETQLNSTKQSNQESQVAGQFAAIFSQVQGLTPVAQKTTPTVEEGRAIQAEPLGTVDNEQESQASALPMLTEETKTKGQNIIDHQADLSLAKDNQAAITAGLETHLVSVAEQNQTSELEIAETKQNSMPLIQPSSTENKPLASFVQGEVHLETHTPFKLEEEQFESSPTNLTAENSPAPSSEGQPTSQVEPPLETSIPFNLGREQLESSPVNLIAENKKLTRTVAENSPTSSLEGEHPLETKGPFQLGVEQVEPGTTKATAEIKNPQPLGNISNQGETAVKPETNEKIVFDSVEVVAKHETELRDEKTKEIVSDSLEQALSKLKANQTQTETPTLTSNLISGDGVFQKLSQTPQLNGQLGTSPGGKVNQLPNFLPSENVTKLTTIFNETELKNGDVKTMKIQLEPSSLGEVEIVLEHVGGEVKTKILVGNQQLKELFEKSLPLLELNNQKQGVNLSNIKVAVQQDPTSFANFNHQFQNSPQQHSSQRGKSQKGTNQYRSQPIEEREDTGILANEGVDLLV